MRGKMAIVFNYASNYPKINQVTVVVLHFYKTHEPCDPQNLIYAHIWVSSPEVLLWTAQASKASFAIHVSKTLTVSSYSHLFPEIQNA